MTSPDQAKERVLWRCCSCGCADGTSDIVHAVTCSKTFRRFEAYVPASLLEEARAELGRAPCGHGLALTVASRCLACENEQLRSALEERDRLLDSLAELTAYIDTDQLPPEVQDRLDAALTKAVELLDAKALARTKEGGAE